MVAVVRPLRRDCIPTSSFAVHPLGNWIAAGSLLGAIPPSFLRPFPAILCWVCFVNFAMENCLDLAIRTEGAAGSVAPTIDNYPAIFTHFHITETAFSFVFVSKYRIFYDFCTFICIIEYFFVPLQPIMSYHMLIENRMFNFTPPPIANMS